MLFDTAVSAAAYPRKQGQSGRLVQNYAAAFPGKAPGSGAYHLHQSRCVWRDLESHNSAGGVGFDEAVK
jgi:hypothetical protein